MNPDLLAFRRFRDNIGESLHHVFFSRHSFGAVGDVVSQHNDVAVVSVFIDENFARVLISSMHPLSLAEAEVINTDEKLLTIMSYVCIYSHYILFTWFNSFIVNTNKYTD
jgi:hypothetical protein